MFYRKKRGRKEYESNTNLMDMPEEDLTGKEKTKRTANLRVLYLIICL